MAHEKSKRQQILDAAKTLFARHGFQATTTDAVASEAGVAVGTIYNYFRNKDDLLSAIFREALDQRLAYWQALAADPSPLARILGFIGHHFRDIAADPRLGVILVHCHASAVAGVQEFQGDLRRSLTEALREAVARREVECDPDLTAVVLLGTVEALVREGVRREGRVEDFFSRATAQISQLLNGLKAHQTEVH